MRDSHRGRTGFCSKCSGNCLFDHEGKELSYTGYDHDHPSDSGDGEPCQYRGANMWDCGVVDNES